MDRKRPIYDRLPYAMRHLSETEGLFLSADEHRIKFTSSGEIVISPGHITFPEGEIRTKEIVIGNANTVTFTGPYIPGTEYLRGQVVSAPALDGSTSYITFQESFISTDLAEDLDSYRAIEVAITDKNVEQHLYFVQDAANIDYYLEKPWGEDAALAIEDYGTFNHRTGTRTFTINGKIEKFIIEYENGLFGTDVQIFDSNNILLDTVTIERSFGLLILDTTANPTETTFNVTGTFDTITYTVEGGYQIISGETDLTVQSVNIFLTTEFVETPNRIANLGRIHLNPSGVPDLYESEKLIASQVNHSVADWLTRGLDEFLLEKLTQVENYNISTLTKEDAAWKLQQVGIERSRIFDIDLETKTTWFLNAHTKQPENTWPFTNAAKGRHEQILRITILGPGDYIVNDKRVTTVHLWDKHTYILLDDALDIEVSGGAEIRNGKLIIENYQTAVFTGPISIICHRWINTSDWNETYEDWHGLYPSKGTKESIHFMFDLLRLHGYDSDSVTVIPATPQNTVVASDALFISEENDFLISENGSFFQPEVGTVYTPGTVYSTNEQYEFTPTYLDLAKNLRIESFPPFRAGLSMTGDPLDNGKAYLRLPPNYDTKLKYIDEILARFAGPDDVRVMQAFFVPGLSRAGDAVFNI